MSSVRLTSAEPCRHVSASPSQVSISRALLSSLPCLGRPPAAAFSASRRSSVTTVDCVMSVRCGKRQLAGNAACIETLHVGAARHRANLVVHTLAVDAAHDPLRLVQFLWDQRGARSCGITLVALTSTQARQSFLPPEFPKMRPALHTTPMTGPCPIATPRISANDAPTTQPEQPNFSNTLAHPYCPVQSERPCSTTGQ